MSTSGWTLKRVIECKQLLQVLVQCSCYSPETYDLFFPKRCKICLLSAAPPVLSSSIEKTESQLEKWVTVYTAMISIFVDFLKIKLYKLELNAAEIVRKRYFLAFWSQPFSGLCLQFLTLPSFSPPSWQWGWGERWHQCLWSDNIKKWPFFFSLIQDLCWSSYLYLQLPTPPIHCSIFFLATVTF